MPQATQAKTIQQIWNCPPITEKNLHLINDSTALFHHCKTGTLIETLSKVKFPQWINQPQVA